MRLKIYRGTKEIGGTLIEVKTDNTRLLFDAGYPLFLNNKPIDDNVKDYPTEKLLELGVLPDIDGLYTWDVPAFDAVIISHAHIDHYGLLKYINSQIPIYVSRGTKKLIEVSQLFGIIDDYSIQTRPFNMYEQFNIGDIQVKPFLMDHSAFDAAAFEIIAENKTIIYTGDFRGHGRKAICLDRFIDKAKKQADLLLIEGTMFGRQDEEVLTENELEMAATKMIQRTNGAALFQSSSQNIDRLVSFYKAAIRTNRTFVVDVYTANVLFELRQLGNRLPYPSKEYSNIKVFYPYYLTQKIFNQIGEEYAKRFSEFHISREQLKLEQDRIVMQVRPSMKNDLLKCDLHDGIFIYSLWDGYRESEYQQRFEESLQLKGFELKTLHTSGHAAIDDIKRLIDSLEPIKVIPIHSMVPESFLNISGKTVLVKDKEIVTV